MANFLERLFKKEQQRNPVVQEQRDFHVPEKVFIEREGPYYEWSEQEPAALKARLWNLVDGFYSRQNYIQLYRTVPEVFAPVHEIASRVADANWQLVKEWNDEVDYKDADFNRLFSQPNPYMNHRELVYDAVCYEILTGRQFFHFNQPDTLTDEYKSILTWTNLAAQDVHVEMKKNADPYTATDMNDLVVRYSQPLGSRTRYFETRNILPIYHLSFSGGLDFNNCTPMIAGAEKAIRNLIPVYEARGIIYIKRGAMGFLVSQKTDQGGSVALTPKEKDSVNRTVNDMYGLSAGKHTIGVTDQPVRFERTSMSIAEMEPFAETLADACAIYCSR